MSHALAELNRQKKWQDDEIVKATRLMWTRMPSREQARYQRIAEQKKIILQKANLIGAICVQYNLPSGDPCWMAKNIADYF
jgi:hypothetical protein